MPLLHLLILAIIQGITEFLPISSSGHLILLPALTGAEDQGQILDVAVHVGTLLAVMIYFWKDVGHAIAGLPRLSCGKADTPGSRLALLLIVATIPGIIFGLFLAITGIDDMLRSVAVIGWTMLIFGLVLYWADRRGDSGRPAEDWTMKDAIILGFWQAVALIPGTSRSGITITGALFAGFERQAAAKISMLMSIPMIIAAAAYEFGDVMASANMQALRDGAIAALFAFLSALVALVLMMRLLRSVSFTPYVIYRVILGVILLGYAYLFGAPEL
ncbi:undecaprenyl-diphosphate phosphatase [Pseudooceanicola sp. CBS1P-1]|uniref:Undecaprenyl-diphosphatase n=1 Tax=Pseudooceanicola albus TaxID=2692189 RepID=A0A6L7FYC3_9RHOB|nr:MULTISPECIES: undecaprenyl-diphosphate phosphatase [Pseudooceanicola]MBT9383908.1 undecaprenyl-diphosphate phosphatase [Pseudooceanicola endophyticus]MXN16679.1 undecaprenyl-diphosphate phosphatase [Pseudooceanicola albus]